MTYEDLANIIFPNIDKTVDDYRKIYSKRKLEEGQNVTRFAPSPTGFMHIGNFVPCVMDYVLAKNSNGVFYLRNEDTDQSREVDGALQVIIDILENYKLTPDEYEINGKIIGNYGPYRQSERKEIYHAFIKELIKKGRAYPCFMSKEEMDDVRKLQESAKLRIGIYGEYSKYRDYPIEKAIERIKNGEKFVIRFKSMGDFNKKFVFHDLVRGDIEFPENDQDQVIMKSDNLLPTYHFAHVVDDYLMGTTHVVRGEEWLSSVPLHIELFSAFGFETPKYIHNSLILKKDGDTVRKISKRKDPEASMSYYDELGYPPLAVIEAVMTIANSNYEEWHTENPDKMFYEFPFNPEKISSSGAFFDLEKLDNIAKNYISSLSANEVYENLCCWAKKYDEEFYNLIVKYKDYMISVLNIEREVEKPRKDIACYSQIKDLFYYMFDEYFFNDNTYDGVSKEYKTDGLREYFNECYNKDDSEEEWFNNLKEFASHYGYTANRKEYKENPDKFNGTVAKFCEIIRVMLTKSNMSPNLYDILKLMDNDRIEKRLDLFLEYLSK